MRVRKDLETLLYSSINEDMPPVLKFYGRVLFKGAVLLVTRMVLYEDIEFVVDKNSAF